MHTPNTTAVSGTLSTDNAVECTFDADGTGHLMSILSNMYRDKALATLREYAANARDAHIAAGNPAPIEITLPTAYEPTLIVKDYGTGLSEAEIITIYSRYGKSTKRGTNTQVGAFGIGAKSAFTIASQFIVTAIKDGRKTTALFALNAAGVATVDIRGRAATDDPNGVTVSVAVDDAAPMRQAATTLFATWEPGTVLVDGETPEYLPSSMLHITDTLYAHRVRGADQQLGLTVVMGGISYPASDTMLRLVVRDLPGGRETQAVLSDLTTSRRTLNLLAFVPIGDVDITPSREDLRDTPRTIAALRKVITDYIAHRAAAVARALDAEPTPLHASVRLGPLFGFLRTPLSEGTTWRGQWLSGKVYLPHPVITIARGATTNRTKFEQGQDFWLGGDITGTLVITGVDDTAAKTVRRLANRFMTARGLTTLVLAPSTQGNVGWWAYGGDSPLRCLPFATFKVEATALAPVTTRREPSYDVIRDGYGRTLACQAIRDAIAAGHRVLLATNYLDDNTKRLAHRAMAPTDVLVMLTGTQTESAFRRRFPNVETAGPVLRGYARSLLDNATEQEHHALDYRQDNRIERLKTIADLHAVPSVNALIRSYTRRASAAKAMNETRLEILRSAKAVIGIKTSAQATTTGYPLLDLLIDHLTSTSHCGPLSTELREDLTRYLAAAQTTQLAA